MNNTQVLTLVGVDTFGGFLRWTVFTALVIITFYLLIKNVKIHKKKVGVAMLILTLVAAPFLLLTIIKKDYRQIKDTSTTAKTDDTSNVEVPKTNQDETPIVPDTTFTPIKTPTYEYAELPAASTGINEGATDQGQGQSNQGSENQESGNQESGNQGSENQGSEDPIIPPAPTTYHLTINNPEFVATDISGDYEYETELFVAAIDREDTNYFFEYWEDGDGNQVATDMNYLFTMPESDLALTPVYRFEDPFPEVWSINGTCTFAAYQENGAYHGLVSGTDCAQYAGQEYIDTGIALYSAENINKDFEVSFTLTHFDPEEQLTKNQETIFTDKAYNWKAGVVYRQADDRLSIVSRKNSNEADEERFFPVDGQRISIMRYNNDLYYRTDESSAYVLLQEDSNVISGDSFDLTAWFGAAPNSDDGTELKRFITGEISDMSIRLGENKFANYTSVNFNANGGSLAHDTYYAESGSTIGILPVATRSKKALIGWFGSEGQQISADTIINGGETFTAQWIDDIENAKLANVKIETIIGEETQIRISNLDSIEPVEYSSNDESIATISDSGLVTGIGEGETDINVIGALSGKVRTVHAIVHTTRLTVHFDAGEGTTVEDVFTYPGSTIDPLPRTTREGYTFLGWFDEYGDELESDTVINTDNLTYYAAWDEGAATTTLVCKKAQERHVETCDRTSNGCYAAGHSTGSDIIYGTLPGTDTPQVGYAYDCDVNGDNKYNANTERFYYIGTNGNNGILISFSNFEGVNGQLNENVFGYTDVQNELPTTTQWGNENLVQFEGKPARILNKSELQDSCGASTTTGSLDTCEFLLENTKYAGEDNGRSAYWLVKTSGTYNRVFAPNRAIATVASNSNNAVRPVIEVPLELIQQGSDVYVTFVFGDGRADEQRGPIGPGEIVGTLPIVADKEHARFLGWYTEATGGERIGKYTIPAGDDTHYYGHWEIDQYTVEFINHNDTDNIEITVEYNAKIGDAAPEDPIKDHYDFAGWYTEETGGDKIEDIADYTVSGNTTFHAQWTVKKNTVTFNLHNDSDNTEIEVNYNEAIGTQAPENLTRKHYSFDGWYTEETGGNKIEDISAYIVLADIELHAHWSPIAVCQVAKEETLHTETCTRTDGKGCQADGYTESGNKHTTTVTYGTVYNNETTLAAGTAMNCDVNGDGVFDSDTERFYYLYSTDNIGTLIYHKNTVFNNALAYNSSNHNYDIPTALRATLPTSTEWSNVELQNPVHQIINENGGTTSNNGSKNLPEIDYTGYAGRMATVQDIKKVCSNTSALGNCNYLLEQTTYANASGGSYVSSYWLETPLSNSGANVDIAHGSNRKIDYKSANNTSAAGVRVIIEVPLEFFDYDPEEHQSSDEIDEFNSTNPALIGYKSTITGLLPEITTFNKDTNNINNSTWGITDKPTFLASLKSNFETNECMVPSYSDSAITNWTSGNVDCSKPLAYDTGINDALNVYLYDPATSTRGDQVAYTKSSTGLITNMIPGQTYYWEKAGDATVYGYVKNTATNTTRFIDADGTRNVRDLGGLTATYTDEDNTVKTGTLAYGKLFRGERLWKNQNNDDTIVSLGVDKEYALISENDDPANDDKLENYVLRNLIHYDFAFGGANYDIARQTVSEIMQDVAAGNDIYFHCRVGADRTGTMAYLLEGLLGVSDEDRYQEYELTHLSGLVDRNRYYDQKASNNNKKFLFMMDYVLTNEDIYDWYMAGTQDEDADKTLIQNFRDAMINYN